MNWEIYGKKSLIASRFVITVEPETAITVEK